MTGSAAAARRRRPPRWPVRRARRLDRVGLGDRRRPRGSRLPGRADPHRPRRRLVAAARRPVRRPATAGVRRPGRPRRDRTRAAAGRSTGSPRATRDRSCSSPSTGRSARTARSRRSSRRRAAYTGSGVTASAIGMDKAIFKRLARGLGLPLADWREVPATAGPPTGPRPRRARGVRGGHRRPAADGQAGAARQLGRDVPRPRTRRARRGDRRRPPPRLARAGRGVPGRRPRPRGLVIGNDPARLELYGPGEIVAGPRVLRLRGEIHAGPVADVAGGPRSTRPPGPTILKFARDAYRAIGAEGFARVDFLLNDAGIHLSEINTIPGFTPISLFPACRGRRRLHVRRGRRADRRARPRTARSRGPAPAPPGGPAPMSGRRTPGAPPMRRSATRSPGAAAESAAHRRGSTAPGRSPCSGSSWPASRSTARTRAPRSATAGSTSSAPGDARVGHPGPARRRARRPTCSGCPPTA